MKIIDLRPDSKLLKPNFDGYKLSLEPIPILRLENIAKPHQITPDSSAEFSFLHQSLFQLQNHLVSDPWLSNTAYFLDSTSAIQKVSYDSKIGKLKALQSVYRCSIKTDRISGVYNVSFKFISEKFAVLSDGISSLKILDTGDRQKSNEWKLIESLQPLEGAGFILQDCKLEIQSGEKLIHALLLHVDQLEGKSHNVVDWLTLKQAEGTKNWSEFARRTIQGKGSLYYISLDPKCNAIVYSSNHPYKYTQDTTNEIVEEPPLEEKIENLQVNEPTQPFQWTQAGEDININFKTIPEATNDQYSVKCEKNHITVTCGEQTLLKSDLYAEVDSDLTTWSFQKEFIQISLIKKQPELIWPYLTLSGPPMETAYEREAEALNVPVSDFNSQMEECDYGEQGEDDEFFIERLDLVTHKPSHKVFLGATHPLFSTTLRPGFPQAIAVRSDVDCCLWLQKTSHSDDDEWSLKHESTLHAFGYIQASKQQRKYLQCSPDCNLAVISESSRHIFIYKNSYNTANGLRKRNGPQLTIGQQKVVSLDGSNGEILGILVENGIIILLTENAVCCLQMEIEE